MGKRTTVQSLSESARPTLLIHNSEHTWLSCSQGKNYYFLVTEWVGVWGKEQENGHKHNCNVGNLTKIPSIHPSPPISFLESLRNMTIHQPIFSFLIKMLKENTTSVREMLDFHQRDMLLPPYVLA